MKRILVLLLAVALLATLAVSPAQAASGKQAGGADL